MKLSVFIIGLTLMASHSSWGFACHAQNGCPGHLPEAKAILGGFGTDPAFIELFNEIGTEIDAMPGKMAKEYHLTKDFNGHTHRLWGHGQALDQPIPNHVLEALEKEYGLPKNLANNHWRSYQARIWQRVQQVTGLPHTQAKSFACLLWDIHLLGDLEPGNTALKHMLPLEKVSENLIRHLKDLLGQNSEAVTKLGRRISQVITEGQNAKMVVQDIAELAMDEVMRFQVGGRLRMKLGDNLKLTWNENAAINARKWVSERTLQRTTSAETRMAQSFKDTLSKTASAKMVKAGPQTSSSAAAVMSKAVKKEGVEVVKNTTGVIQKVVGANGAERFILSAHVPGCAFQGVSGGVLTFVVDETISAVGFVRGTITEDEFVVQTWRNIGAAIVVGTAIAVSVALGATPGGIVVLAVSIGAYILYDFVFSVLYKINKSKGITLDDYLGVLPTDIQRAKGALDYEGTAAGFGYKGDGQGLGYRSQDSGLDYRGQSHGLDDPTFMRNDEYGL